MEDQLNIINSYRRSEEIAEQLNFRIERRSTNFSLITNGDEMFAKGVTLFQSSDILKVYACLEKEHYYD